MAATTAPDDAGGRAGSGGQVSAELVNGLAREVNALRRSVRVLAGLPQQVRELDAALARAIEEMAGAARSDRPARPVSWLIDPAADRTGEAGDPELAARRLTELAVWVGQVYLRYPIAARELPDCWLWHPDVVEELAWLHQAWLIAYDPELGSVAAVGDWHDRYRPGVAGRIRQAARNCSLHEHRSDDRPGGQLEVPSAGSVAPVAVWWSTRRDTQPPAPSAADHDQADRRLEGRRR